MAFVLATACGSSAPVTAPIPSGTLRISGSGTVYPIAVALAQAYHAQNARALFRITSDGTARGIKYASEGVVMGLTAPLASEAFSIPDGNTGPTVNGEAVDVGISSRNLLPDEREDYTLAVATTICIDGLAVAVNPDVTTVNNLTIAQVRDIYAGNTTNWSVVGGPNLPIFVIVRDAISGTAGAWESLVMNGLPVVMALSIANAPDVTAAVAMNPWAIGYLSFNYLAASVHPVSIEGVAPTVANLSSQQYPIRRPFLFVTSPTARALTRAFVAFTLSPAGVAVLEANGEVPPQTGTESSAPDASAPAADGSSP